MSSAKKGGNRFSLCLHKRKSVFALFYRAKPVSPMEQSGIGLTHCGVAGKPPQSPPRSPTPDTKQFQEEINMKDGFFRVAAATPKVKVADPVHNREQICIMIEEGEKNGAGLMVFPELCLTAYTCGDLFLQDTLIRSAKKELKNIQV